jgi:formylglycine-generating enzyme required for sulfatase activity
LAKTAVRATLSAVKRIGRSATRVTRRELFEAAVCSVASFAGCRARVADGRAPQPARVADGRAPQPARVADARAPQPDRVFDARATRSVPSSKGVVIDWVEVPAGLLVQGTPIEDIDAIAAAHADIGVQRSWIAKEAPRRELALPSFAIARTPVTLELWSRFADEVGWPQPQRPHGPDHPIDGVRWDEANYFCTWLADKHRWRVRLPTESEWERAARGGDAREYPWGDRYEPGRANLADLRIRKTTPVGSFPRGASPFGILDLAGNVDEWTATPYAPYPGAPPDAPSVAVANGVATDPHVTRGGGFIHNRDLARCARRHGLFAPVRGVGFRLVLESAG